MLTKIEISRIVSLLKREVVPAIGCTEPAAVALAVARATELLGETPEFITAKLSANIIKNAMGVGIPGSEGMVGLPAAIALASIAGRSDYGLEVLRDVTHESVLQAKTFIAEKRFEVQRAKDCFEMLYIEINASAQGKVSEVIIAKEHSNFVYQRTADGEVLCDKRDTLATSFEYAHGSDLTLQKVYEFAVKAPIEDLRFLLESVRMNKAAAELAFSGDYGLNLGKMLKGSYECRMVGQNAMPRIVTYTCAACDVRMAGALVPIMSNSGSGNQGIACTLPILVFAEETQASESKMVRALALSHLSVIYIKQLLGRLSAHCGCVIAATGSACGITLMMGGDYEHICYAVKNMIAGQTGMVCDGAKPSCTLKLSSAVSSAFQAAMMAMHGITVSSTEGIIEEDVDKTIRNLAVLGSDAMQEVDKLILNIMVDKKLPETVTP